MVYQRAGQKFKFSCIARNLNVALSTAHRIYNIFEDTGTVAPAPQPRREEQRKLSERNELHVVGFVLENPTMYLREVCDEIHDTLNINVSPPTICKLLKHYAIIRKKMMQVAKQRNNALRGAYIAQCSLLNPNMFVWLDETGSDRRDSIRKFGYGMRGMRVATCRLLSRGQRVNVIAAMALNHGIIATGMTTSTVNGDTFFDFVRGTLLPNMLPFDGMNEKSILVMDNCSVHHIEPVITLLRQAGIVALFLPPYSPDLNPLEEVFSYVKGYFKKHDSILQYIPDPSDVIKDAFDSLTIAHCNAFIHHCGYN